MSNTVVMETSELTIYFQDFLFLEGTHYLTL